MATMEETRETIKTDKSPVAPFAVAADHPRNCDLLLQSVPNCRLRSSISASKPTKSRRTGEMVIPPDQAAYLGQFPPIPGMQIHVNPGSLSYAVVDPLADDDDLCDRITKAMNATGGPIRVDSKVRGVPTLKGKLDVHRMKTLVRELVWIVQSGEGKVVKGALPEMKDVERLPGNFMLNPGSQVPNQQPVYECDYDEWLQRLTRSGG
jgi:hypothetical protein